MKKFFALTLILFSVLSLNAQVLLYEGFENFDSLITTGGWFRQNNSAPLGTHQWENGSIYHAFNAYSGTANSYAEADVLCTDSIGIGNISAWLLTPALSLQNGDSIEFYTTSTNSNVYADRLECRLSTMGASDNVGTLVTNVGDFSTLIVSVNPLLDNTAYPVLTWTKFSGVVSGLSGATSCKVGFRYWVTNSGGAGGNGSSILLDDVKIFRFTVGVKENENSPALISVYPNPAKESINICSEKEIRKVTITDMLGDVVYNSTDKAGKIVINTSSFENGIYFVHVESGEQIITKKIEIIK